MNSKHLLTDVFTPNKPAILTFVERAGINNKLVRALKTPGKQIVVFGHSGCGKTTLLLNKLYQTYERHITTRCLSTTTFEQIILDAFDQLDPYFCSEKGQKQVKSIDASLSAAYLGIKSEIGAGSRQELTQKRVRALPVQLTPQRLAKFLGAAECAWVIEDFHKVGAQHKRPLAETMKIFVDTAAEYPFARIIALGAVSTARDVVEWDSNMKGRVAEVEVDLMNDDEIRQIIALGEQRLNVIFPGEVKDDIVKYSNGLAMVCHQLSLNTCDAHGIHETIDSTIPEVIEADDFGEAVENYVEDESDSLQQIFDEALRQKRKRKFDNCRLILKALATSKEPKGLSKADLMLEIRKDETLYPAGNLTVYLEQLESDERHSLLRYDSASGKYDYTNPFHKVYARLLFTAPMRRPRQLELPFESLTLSTVRLQRIHELLIQSLGR